jgi:hypothetical protein
MSYFNFIKNDNIIYKIISREVHYNLMNNNVQVYNNINADELLNQLLNSHYILVTDLNYNHLNCYSISASIAYAFSTGCQLIIPEKMNQYLRLKSAILYNNDSQLLLRYPNYDLVYDELNEFINKRDRILDKLCNI